MDISQNIINTENENAHIILTKKECAEYIGVSISTISRMVKDKRLPPPLKTPSGRNGGWFKSTIDKWIKNLK